MFRRSMGFHETSKVRSCIVLCFLGVCFLAEIFEGLLPLGGLLLLFLKEFAGILLGDISLPFILNNFQGHVVNDNGNNLLYEEHAVLD